MSRIVNQAISACLIGGGVFAWAFAGRSLVTNPDLKAPLNPLGINGSPYGEVFAMAMQGPIDTYFHGATSGSTARHKAGHDCADCKEDAANKVSKSTMEGGLGNFLASLDKMSGVRTNPKAASDAHKLFLRRQVEDKLRFAYQLDPSHYANYNSLHFFLTEPELGTRPQLTQSAARLAEETIQYCLKQDKDPRPALTAAAAVTNILELMFNDQKNEHPKFTTVQMRQYMNLLDYCIDRYVGVSKVWDQSNNWELLSPQRIVECEDRFSFICKIRETDLKTIERFEGNLHADQASK